MMSKRFGRVLAFLCCLLMVAALMPTSFAAATDNNEYTEALNGDSSSTALTSLQTNETPTAIFGTPELGSDDPLWALTMEHLINKSTVPGDPRPHSTGTARILWDQDYLYARVVVEDGNLYQGPGNDYQYDGLEFYAGAGTQGANQWRISATGVFSGQNAPGRAAWTEITDTGYIVEMRIPKRTLNLQAGPFTFEVYINNSSEKGGDRYEVVSCFGTPDAAYNNAASYTNSLNLIAASGADDRFSITATAESGGRITPNAPGNVLRIASGSDTTLTVTPDYGKIVDTVKVDGEDAVLSDDGTYTFSNVVANHTLQVTFKNDSAAELLPFIVWNDNFARGEYTTAVIIDLGEGKSAEGSKLNPDLFTVSARNTTLNGDSVTFEGTRKITRVYANDEPKVRGYLGTVSRSPDYQDGLERGRYIVVEFEFYSESGGNITLDGNMNSTKQVYSVVQNGEIPLTEGDPLNYAVFEQEKVVNPILDQFTAPTGNSVNRALYLHKDGNGEVSRGLPLYVYTHGRGRGGTSAATDPKAAMKSANGSVALMKKMEKSPEKYASHILNISYNGTSTPSTANVKKVIDDLVASGAVDPNRIYAAGFSWGGQYTNSLINAYPGFFASAAPMSPVSGSPNANANYVHTNLAYWMFINEYNVGVYQTNLANFINTNMPKMINARASRFESNEALVWPYNQFDQPNQKPNPNHSPALSDSVAHEVEAAVLYNDITMGTWSIAPTAQSSNLPAWNNDYTDVFDWMFAQTAANHRPVAGYGSPVLSTNDKLWEQAAAFDINNSSAPDQKIGPMATGKAKVFWDEDFLYARVVVTDPNVCVGHTPGTEYMTDSVEFYVGDGKSGSNQWRIGASGIFSGQAAEGRDGSVTRTDTGYIAEVKIPRRTIEFTSNSPITFDVYINNSTGAGNDRYEVVSALGKPDAGYGNSDSFKNSLLLLGSSTVTRHPVNATAGLNGTISPSGLIRVADGGSQSFTFTPIGGYVVDTVTVNGESVEIANNTYTLNNVNTDDKVIHVTFKPDPAATLLNFIVYNDNFATGEFTTAVIIDLGAGNEAVGAGLSSNLFTVSARNTLFDGSLAYQGTRTVNRVYVNDQPRPRGYKGVNQNSPDYQAGLTKGRYIVVELEFWTLTGGQSTLEASKSTVQNYNIVSSGDIKLDGKAAIVKSAFAQSGTVNEIIDKFEVGPKIDKADAMQYGLYIHKDGNGAPVKRLPLYIYAHGSTRGGTQDGDTFAPIRSANGATALMKKMEKNAKYASHIIALRAQNNVQATPATLKAYIDDLVSKGLVDPNRIYMAGFSMGAAYTNTFLTTYPDVLAAAAPMSFPPSINAKQADALKSFAYWSFVNTTDSSTIKTGAEAYIANIMPLLENARHTFIDRNEIFVWPYDQWTKAEAPVNGTNWIPSGHEMEASVLWNNISGYTDTLSNVGSNKEWSLKPTAQSSKLPTWNNDYTDVFDWMFAQRKTSVPGASGGNTGNTSSSGNTGNTSTSNTGNTSTGTVTGSLKPTYTVNTPKDKPAVTDKNGNTILPGGGEITTKGGTKIKVPEGTTIDSKGKVTIPAGKSAEVTLHGGASAGLDKGMSLNIHEGTEFVFEDDTPLGFRVVSGNPFRDVNMDDWFYSYVNSAYTYGLFNGTTSTTFSPGTSMTRAMYVQVLANLENVNRSSYTNSRFSDVMDGQWYTAAVEWAAESGIVNGINADLFEPNSPVTREQMLVMLYNYMKYKGYEIPESQSKSFADESQISSWALKAVQAQQGIGIVSGKPGNFFAPQANATRAEVATIFIKFIEYLAK
ncbi:sugar-binding protein [Paenibacillus sp. FSL R7-0210]|uniref:sugar-binding protein n=1 Tax=Paenibacillus sp. FSL R7-0210 TaxID=2921676 RepID=UPI0030F63CC5